MWSPARIRRLNAQRYTLQGTTCPRCAVDFFPPRDICLYCGKSTEAPHKFPEGQLLLAMANEREVLLEGRPSRQSKER